MTLRPLPVPTRLYGGEDVNTFARRAAARNGTEDRWIGNALWSSGIVTSVSDRHPSRLQAWRELGALHESAFTTPTVIADEWVTDRVLCIQCTGGHVAVGRLPRVGNVCVKHRRWLGQPDQPRVHAYPAVLTAERHYRTRLAPRDILFDGSVMRLAAECARVALSPTTITERQTATGLPVDAVIYPEQVAFCRLIARPSLLAWAVAPTTDPTEVRQVLDRESRHIVGADDDNEPWRASTRLQTVVFTLRNHTRQASTLTTGRGTPSDRWNLLRHLPGRASDSFDEWSGAGQPSPVHRHVDDSSSQGMPDRTESGRVHVEVVARSTIRG